MLHRLTPQKNHIVFSVQLYFLIISIVLFISTYQQILHGDPLTGVWLIVIICGFFRLWTKVRAYPDKTYSMVASIFKSNIIQGSIIVFLLIFGSIPIIVDATTHNYENVMMPEFALPISIITLLLYSFLQFHFTTSSTSRLTITNRTILISVICAGIVGGIIGYLFPRMHVAIEQGQVLAGTINYLSTDNAWYVYQVKLWNFWGWFTAVGLNFGISEINLAIFLSTLIGILFFVNMTLLLLAMTRHALFAISMNYLIYLIFTNKSLLKTLEFGYPYLPLDNQHTYGMFGMAFMVLILALFVLPRYRVAFFLLGFSPFIHPSLSIWLHVTLLVFVLTEYKNLISWVKRGLWVIIGYVVCLSTLLLQRLYFPIEPLPPDVEETYLATIIENYATHGSFILEYPSSQTVFLLMVLFISIIVLTNNKYSQPLKTVAKLLLIISSIGIIGTIITYSNSYLGNIITVLLPNRFLTIVLYLLVPLVISMLVLLIIDYSVTITNFLHSHYQSSINVRFITSRILPSILILGYIMFISNQITVAFKGYESRYNREFGKFDSSVFKATATADGFLLITPDLHTSTIQVYSQRPLLLNIGALDNLPYTVEAGPITAEILRDVYDIDFFNPPEPVAMTHHINEVWAERTVEDWQVLAAKYGFSQVLVASTRLKLPLVAENEPRFHLYEVPDS